MKRSSTWCCLLVLLTAGACSLPGLPGSDAYDAVIKDNPFVEPDNFVPSDTDAPAFLLTGLDPTRGPTPGGTRVELSGTGFLDGSKVIFGASEGLEVVVQNDGSILTSTPPGNPGLVDVSVVRPDGKTVTLPDGFFYESEIHVQGVHPSSGPAYGGTPVRITGTGFMPDSTLVVGGRLAVSWHIQDSGTLVAITPPGTPGPRDVTVFNSLGSATAHKGFTYLAQPALDHCDPVSIQANQTTEVMIHGSGLDATTGVLSTNGSVQVIGTPQAGMLLLALTPAAAGPVGLTILSTHGKTDVDACTWALPAPAPLSPPRVHGLVPASGSTSGGYRSKVIVSGLPLVSAGPIEVSLDGASAPVVASDADLGFLEVEIPAHDAGVVDCAVEGSGWSDAVANVFEYLPDVTISDVTPVSGPSEGGTTVTLTGTRLEQVDEVYIGPLPATILAGPSPGSIKVSTAPANPGIHDVAVVTAWGERVVLEDAFTFGAEDPGLFIVTPGTGSQAGGTLISVVGSGLSKASAVHFGDMAAEILDATDPARILVNTPPHSPGPVDVMVTWPDGTERTLHQAYTYFDPTGYFGGVWGDVVNGAVNVTVLDSYNGKPVQGAFVILGETHETPYLGTTDIRGQITLSGEDVFGPVQVSASRPDYSTFTLSGADAENITVFLDPAVPTSSGGGGTSAQPLSNGLVTGRVLGADKYLLAPPASCENRPLIYGTLCAPCVDGSTCGESGLCLNPSGKGHYCATSCLSEDDCPSTYDCYGLGSGQLACLPSPGNIEIRCGTSVRNTYSFEEDPGPGYLVGSDGIYALNSRLGDIAVYCVGGIRRWEDGVFDPVAMGLLRHVSVYPAQVTDEQDILLSIPLDRELTVRLLNAPGGPGGPNVHKVALTMGLGSDGSLRLWPDQKGLDRDRYVFQDLPRVFLAGLEDATLYLEGDAASQTPNGIPYSASVLRDWVPGLSPRLVRVSGDLVEMLDPDVRPDAVGGCGLPEGGGLIFSPGGLTWEVSPDGLVEPVPSLASATLRDCRTLPDGGLIAVGDRGSIVRYDGFISTQEVVSTSRRLTGVDVAADGTEYAVGDGVLFVREAQSEWKAVDYGSKAPLYDVVAAPDGSALAVGAGGIVVRIRDSKAVPQTPYPTEQDLYAVTAYGWGVFMVGARGTTILGGFDGGHLPIPTSTWADLLTVRDMDNGEALAAGAVGTLLRYRDGEWAPLATPDFQGEVTTLLPGSQGSILALSTDVAVIGPFLHLPLFTSPVEGDIWTDLDVGWSRDAPPEPSLTYTRLYGPKSSREWAIMADGPIEAIRLPDLALAAAPFMALAPLPGGNIRLHSLQILMDHFDFNSFDNNAFSMSSWRSWTVDEFTFLKP